MDRAYAVLQVKTLDAERRTITGIAATPAPDRHGDIFETRGATFANPLPLLLHHDKERPIGRATLTTTPDAITFEATLPVIPEAGALRDRVEEAWQSIKAGLITGVSIGFRPLQDGVKFLKSGGLHLLKTEICELSLVTVPANVATTIHTIKSFDAPHLAAFGLHSPGVAGLPVVRVAKDARTMKQTTAEQITNWENKRAAHTARMGELMTKAADAGTTLDAEQTDEYDGLELEVKSMDAHLVRLRALEKTQIAAATPPSSPITTPANPVVSVKSNVPPGTAFTRYALALLNSKGDSFRALEFAKRWHDSTPEVELMIKAAVAPGTTTDPAWAGALVTVSNATNEFIELLRPATILGKVPNLRRVPFNTSVPIQTAGGTYKWVGQAKPKPVGKLQFSSTSLGMAKASGIIVLTEELVRSSSPSAEAIVRADMIAGIARFLDSQFIDPAVAEVANVSPASITNGTVPIASGDDPQGDIGALIAWFASKNIGLAGLVLIMSETNAFHMAYERNAMGERKFPGMSATGGTAEGITVIASNTAADNVIAFQPTAVLYADDGGVSIDVSREASLQMNDAPMDPADATTVFTSLWQDNLVGLRAERFINWKRAILDAVKYVSGADYTPTAPV